MDSTVPVLPNEVHGENRDSRLIAVGATSDLRTFRGVHGAHHALHAQLGEGFTLAASMGS